MVRAKAIVLDGPLYPLQLAALLPWVWLLGLVLFCSVAAVVFLEPGCALSPMTRLGAPVLGPRNGLGRGEREQDFSCAQARLLSPFPSGRLWWPAGVRRRPSGSGVLGVRGALWARRHPGSLHQYLQICELDPECHTEQLTCSSTSTPSSGATGTPRAPASPPPSAPTLTCLGLRIFFLELQLQPALLRPMVPGGGSM